MNTQSTPLLQTKFHVPPTRPNLVLRPRLMTQMEDAVRLGHRLTLISARAGSGKTTLVSEWLRQQGRPVAWLSLDEKDNDPWRFFSYLVGALGQLGIGTRQIAQSALETPGIPESEPLITELINSLTPSPTPIVLVLDDYHVIQNDWVHQAVGFLIEHQPQEMHLILTTRVDPPFPLAQWRGRGQLAEIRERDLLFSEHEAVEYLNGVMELDLTSEAVSTIQLRTEGWIAGIQMAAISARGHKQEGDLGTFIEVFSGTTRFVLDYLTDEVLNRQPHAIQEFLIETSVLERMCGGLCDALRFGDDAERDSQSILARLEQTNLFLIPLDDERRWYRYHHLFADLLQSVLRQRRSAEQIRELHRRAGRWYQGEGMLAEAMGHLLAAPDFESAATVIEENAARLMHMFSRSKAPLILSWIENLPEAVRRSRPWLDVYRAMMLALNLQVEGVEPILIDVEQRVGPNSPRASEIMSHIAAIRAYSANLRGDAAHVLAMADHAQKHLPREEYSVARGLMDYTLADTYFATDDMESARQALLDMHRVGEQAGQLMMIVPPLCDLAAIKRVQGRLYEAEEIYEKARNLLVEHNGWESRFRCSYEFGLADLLREWNRLDEAAEHATKGIEYRRRFGGYNLLGDLTLMRVLQSQGDVDGAMIALRKAEQAVRTNPFQLGLMTEFKAARVKQWLAAGDVEMASRCAEECTGGSEQERIALARLWLAQGRISDAQDVLGRQRLLAEAGGRAGRLAEILAMQAIALDAQGLCAEAEVALAHAISLAWPEGYVRVFLDLGLPLRRLLERIAAGGANAGREIVVLLSLFQQERGAEALPTPPTPTDARSDPLTARELEILRLLADGLSNKDIASRLVVSPGTVKQHLKNICRKLDVHGRMQAVRRGRELHLL